MLKLLQFSALTELPALATHLHLYIATASKQQKVFILQQPATVRATSQTQQPEKLNQNWLAQSTETFSEAGYFYRVIPVGKFTLSFFDIVQAVQQGQLPVLSVIESLVRLIAQIHQAGYILAELKAEALFWSAAGDAVCLLDSRFASTVSRVHLLQLTNELDLAMLRTLAPEATGRVHCPLDQRADLYAVGVLSYALVSGRFPFEQQQSLELVHAHIAKKPADLSELNAEIDPRLATVIATLLNKDPNQRYQSAQGLLKDIALIKQTGDNAAAKPFSPARYLGMRQLPFTNTLYERTATLELLQQTLNQTQQAGPIQVVAVQGYSGSGKTSVIAQLHLLTLNSATLFIQGKHDQYSQNAVFSGLKSALQQLAEIILQQPEAELIQWQQRLQHAAGDDALLLTDLVSEWQAILNPTVIPSTFSKGANQRRFDQLLLRIFGVFTEYDRTVVLFLDDMQWADQATLRWLELLVNQLQRGRIMLVMSFRQNEIHARHPLQFTLEAITQSNACLQHITISPLSDQGIMQLLADTLSQTATELQPLADILIQKTSGNPFYLKQFLLKLYQDDLLYCSASGIWQWDLIAISQQAMSEQHAEIVAKRLQQFDAGVQQLLKLVAILGDEAAISVLAGICQCAGSSLEQQLAGPVNAGILIAFTTLDGQQLDHVKFSHDKLQQAAYQLNTSQSEQQLHASVANYYLSQLPTASAKQQQIFSFITHLNAAMPLPIADIKPEQLATYNQMAAQKALTTNAYDTAHDFYAKALEIFEQDNAINNEKLLQEIYAGLAHSSYLTQNYSKAWQWCLQRDQQALTQLERMENCQQKILILFGQNKLAAAFDTAAGILAEMAIDISVSEQIISKYPELLTMYSSDDIGSLISKPALDDTELLQAINILGTLFTVAYIVSPLHYMTVTYQLLRLSLERGNTASSALGYLGHAMHLVAGFAQYKNALQFADLALTVNQHYHGKYHSQLLFQRAAAILPWNAPLHHCIDALDDNFVQALQDGNLEYAAHSALFSSFYRVFSGIPLQQAARHGERTIAFLTEKQFPYNLEFAQIWQQLTLNLSSEDIEPEAVLLLQGSAFDETSQLDVLRKTNNQTILFCYHSIKLMLASLMDDDKLALQHLNAGKPLTNVALALYHQTEYYFFAGLTYCRLLRQPQSASADAILWQQELASIIQLFEGWAMAGHVNHQHKVDLLNAELAALSQQTDAWQLYRRAINQAEQQGFCQHAAIAHERAADYWQQMEQPDFAAQHRQKAFDFYQQWQASAKLRQLRAKYPQLKMTEQNSQPKASDWQLDLASIFKASETLSGKVDLTAFIDTMLHIMVENAGAQHGCLLFTSENDKLEQQAATSPNLVLPPPALFNLVQRTAKARLYNDTSQDPMLVAGYQATELPCSLLCIPIIVNGQFRGILSLQHNSMTGAFPPERIKVLQLLANQTAILFENTQLSQQLLAANKNLEQKVVSRTRELAQAKIKAEAATEAKSAFLARMSHEIRTPINAVIGLSRLASKRQVDADQLDMLDKIRSSGEMLLSLVNDILDFSKVEAGKLRLERTRFSINQVVKQAINMTTLKAHSKGLELITDVSADIPQELIGDPLRIQQLLINLLNNAVKFTEKGSVCILLHGNQTSAGQYQLHGSVSDTGIGMSEQQQKRLFSSFNQADDSITRKYGGSGLGLTICKQLCELMSGEIWLESEPGYGSTFYFTVALQLPEYYQPAEKPSLAYQRRLKALVVDDMALTRMVLLKQLDELGIVAEQTSNGPDAIERVAQAQKNQQPFDFILMDWRMPQMDGIETSRRIQQQLGSKAPHILMVSAYDKMAAKAEMQLVKIDRFIEKPVSYSTLLDAVGPLLYDPNVLSSKHPGSAATEEIPDLSGKRLLLVEDHLINRQVALGFLDETGATVDIAVDGAKALSLLQQQQYDLVLMDIQMPEMDGLTATQLIRNQLQLTDLPIVAMTAHALADDIAKSRAAGMNAHVTKPIIPELLYATLQQLLQVPLKTTALPALKPVELVATNPLQLDEAKARANLGPQAEMYPSLLHIFLNEHRALPEKLQLQLQCHDYEAISRALHSLKAAAAYIGAFGFATLCSRAEAQMLAGRPDPDEIGEVINFLAQLIARLEQQDKKITIMATEPLTGKQLDLELRQLLPLLQQSDFAAEAELERLKQLTKDRQFSNEIAELSDNVANIEFEKASALLQRMLAKLAAQRQNK